VSSLYLPVEHTHIKLYQTVTTALLHASSYATYDGSAPLQRVLCDRSRYM